MEFVVVIATKKNSPCYSQFNRLKLFLDSKITTLIITENTINPTCSLSEHIINFFSPSHKTLHIDGTNTLKPQQLLHSLYQFTQEKKPNLRLRFEDQIQALVDSMSTQQHEVLLTINNAHQLTYSVLAAISHLSLVQESHQPQVQIFLKGKAELFEKMRSIQTRPVTIIQLSLDDKATSQQLSELISKPKQSWKKQFLTILSDLFYPQSSAPSANAHLTQSIKTGAQYIWTTHQVKILSISGLILLSFTMWHINQPRGLHSSIPNMAYKKISTFTPIIASPHLAKATQNHTPFYRIQLLSSPNRKATRQYITQNHLTQLATLQHKNNQYQVTIGHYHTLEQAKKALSALPQHAKKNHPWIRKITA